MNKIKEKKNGYGPLRNSVERCSEDESFKIETHHNSTVSVMMWLIGVRQDTCLQDEPLQTKFTEHLVS